MAKGFSEIENQLTAPRWAGDFMSPERLLPGGARVDPAQFRGTESVLVKLSATAAIGATALVVDPLTNANEDAFIPAGTNMYFGTADEFARTTADVEEGDTSIPVDALIVAIEDNDEYLYPGTGGLKSIPSGTFLGRTFAEAAAKTPFGPADDADDQFYLVAFDVTDADNNADVEFYRHGGLVKTNYLPAFSTLSATLIAKIRALYECTEGHD
jgi:hypothetical protein